jgi:hypothetical protein
MNITVNIERLILDGLPSGPGQAARAQAAVEAEMARLIAERGLAGTLQSDAALSSISAGTIQLTTDSRPSQWGRQIARTIYGALSQQFPANKPTRASNQSDGASHPPNKGERA